MPTLALINFNIVCATLGGFISLFGLVSYLCKERFYLSEACPCPCISMYLIGCSDVTSDLLAGRCGILTTCSQFHTARGVCHALRAEPRSHHPALLFFGIYQLKYIGMGGEGFSGGAGKAMGLWFYETWVYTIILSVVYGAAAEEKRYVDRESFLVFAIALALCIVGTCGLIGTDDLLACFIAGMFSGRSKLHPLTQGSKPDHDSDWFRLETMDDLLQPTMICFSTCLSSCVCPWSSFPYNNIISIYRLIFLGILILLVRRMLIIFAMHKYIHQIEHLAQAAFVDSSVQSASAPSFISRSARNSSRRSQSTAKCERMRSKSWTLSELYPSRQSRLRPSTHNLRCHQYRHSRRTRPLPISAIHHTNSTETPHIEGAGSNRTRKRRSVIRSGSPSRQLQPGVGLTDKPERPVNLAVHSPVAGAHEAHESSPSPAL
ncbi:Na/H antiporter [Penicillium argentinense]|uniref:Na/H antiporter n=1 Tax=Penicillium argentinense TaxID=1131581 RepID=A0A9W9G4C7_9EURO|nr:Na/H antiporter [Penicillium argentinense]KAJ5111410.1 Na/H antiporter [Penicillium argentinense]